MNHVNPVPEEASSAEREIEYHPLSPFLPSGARVLMLGSFPPPRQRWSMEFYYPNFQNDMWRILGLLFERDKDYFVLPGQKRFDVLRAVDFCTAQGIAISDAAQAVRRLRGDASDRFLEVAQPVELEKLLHQIPVCHAVVTTGQKATEVIASLLETAQPEVGKSLTTEYAHRHLTFYRMPSSSRAYPMALEKKAASYRKMFVSLGMLSGMDQ